MQKQTERRYSDGKHQWLKKSFWLNHRVVQSFALSHATTESHCSKTCEIPSNFLLIVVVFVVVAAVFAAVVAVVAVKR